MKTRSTGIFSRIGFFVFFIISALGILFVVVTYNATSEYYQASTQLLNKDIAGHILMFTAPITKNGINFKKADSVFNNTMIISPNTEVYFLDTAGRVKYYHAPDSLIKLKVVPVENIKTYLSDPIHEITNTDPRDPGNPKIFSAAPVVFGQKTIGYIYVILASKEYRNVAEFVFKSRVGGWATKVFFIIILATVIFSLLYTSRLQKRFDHVINILDQFKEGNLNVRFNIGAKDEFFPIADAFNKMVAMLDANFTRLKVLEAERKTFLANISHDLRTPLAVARGYTETLLMDGEGYVKEHEGYQEMILAKIMQVEKLVLQLFELSKMESVNFTPVKTPFAFSEVLQETIMGTEMQAKHKDISIICKNCEDGAFINADISMIERVVQNLLENAVKYTNENGEIRVTLSRKESNLVVIMENTGKAFRPEIQNWINNDLTDEAINRPAKTGLGLALVKRILHLHDSALEVESLESGTNILKFKLDIYRTTTK